MTESIGVRKSRDHSGNDFLIKFPKSGLSYGWRKVIADKLAIDQSSVVKLSNIVLRDGGYEGFKSELGKMARTLGVRIDPQVTIKKMLLFFLNQKMIILLKISQWTKLIVGVIRK